jgi:redox-sensing transcriptional repressor
MRYRKIPDETVRRLPVYLRAALHLSGRGVESTSSRGLAELIGIEPWQIRKDFSYFGDFGIPGVGYNLSHLIKHVNRILRLDTGQKAALVGVGNLGSALLAFPGFRMYGLEISAAFDIDKRKIGRKRSGVLIEDVSTLTDLRGRDICLGIVAVPESASQQIVDVLAEAGVKGILNFSPRHVVASRGMKVITIDIAMDLARLPYYVPAG